MSSRRQSRPFGSPGRRLFPWAILLVVSFQADARAGLVFGEASNYNVFAFQDFFQSGAHADGKVAVGGNAQIQGGFDAAAAISGSNPADDRVVVGSDLLWTGSGEVRNNGVGNGLGNVRVGAGGSIGGSVDFNTLNTGSIPFSFAASEAMLKSDSAYWGGLAANGSAAIVSNVLQLSGSDPVLNVFNLSGQAHLSSAIDGLKFVGIPPGSTVLVNVTGDPGKLNNFSFDLGGVAVSKILFNFVDATQIELRHTDFFGSILAPYATLTFHNGDTNGNVIVKNVGSDQGRSTGGFNLLENMINYSFSGNLPTPTVTSAVPEPGALGLAGTGAMLLAFWRRKQSRMRMRASA